MKVIVFEHLRRSHRALVHLYQRLGYSIRFIEGDSDLHLQGVESVPAICVNPTRGSGIAFDLVERAFPQDHPLIQSIVSLYGSTAVVSAFKKNLTMDLEKSWVYTMLHGHLKSEYPQAELAFVPKSASMFARAAGCVQKFRNESSVPHFDLPPLTPFVASCVQVAAIKNSLSSLAVCVHYLVCSLMKGFPRRAPRQPQKFRFGICVVSPAREFANTIRGVGFLLDHESINETNTVFIPIVPITNAEKAALAGRGFRYADIWEPSGWRILHRLAKMTVRLALRVWRSPDYVARTYAFLVREYGFWSSFTERFSIENLISYCDFAAPHIGRNVLLKGRGVRTWYYIDGANTWDVHLRNDDLNPYRDHHWGYLTYDYFVSWSDHISTFFRRHPQHIGHYLTVGCIWSEHVRLISEGRMGSNLKKELRLHGLRPDQRVVAAFDSTYADGSLTPYSDGIAFAKGLVQLLHDVPNIYLVFKEKKPRSYSGPGAELARIYDLVQKDPRCLFAGYKLSASEIVACADLIISFPFTTTTIEALGVKKRAIYFDAVNKYAGTYYDRVPGFVTLGYEQLLQRVRELLFRISDREYEQYLAEYVKGDIEPFLDGHGLSRFRGLLLMKEPRPERFQAAAVAPSGLTT